MSSATWLSHSALQLKCITSLCYTRLCSPSRMFDKLFGNIRAAMISIYDEDEIAEARASFSSNYCFYTVYQIPIFNIERSTNEFAIWLHYIADLCSISFGMYWANVSAFSTIILDAFNAVELSLLILRDVQGRWAFELRKFYKNKVGRISFSKILKKSFLGNYLC